MPDTYRLTRRAALLLPLATAGCSLFDSWFGDDKKPLPGTRVSVMVPQRGLTVDNPSSQPVTLPQPRANANWPQSGYDPTHAPGHLLASGLGRAWTASIGAGGGYRNKITARPVISGAQVFAMDSDAVVSAFALKDGGRIWATPTAPEDDDSTNVGGGIALDPAKGTGGTLYVSTGLAQVVALSAATGKLLWRGSLPTPARAAPTIAEGKLFVPTIDNQLIALSQDDGKRVWGYKGIDVPTTVLGLPSPAYDAGLLVAGFGSGDLACLRAATGEATWTDGLAASHGRTSLVDLPSVRGLPVIDQGAVFATSLGGLFVSIDLRSGRRLWEREIGSQETPCLGGDWLFVITPDAQMAALNRSDGLVAWVSQLPQLDDPTDKKSDTIRWLAPELASGRLIVPGTSKQMLALDPTTGAVVGKIELSSSPSVPPVIAAGMIFIVTDDGVLTAYR